MARRRARFQPEDLGLYRSEIEQELPEKVFTVDVLAHAKLHGWTTAHFKPAWVAGHGKPRMITPVAGDGKGYLDIELVRGPRLLKVELKSLTGTLSEEQKAWIERYQAVPWIEVYLWRPNMWAVIREVLN